MKRRMLYYSAFILIMGTVLIVLSGESQAQNVLTFEVRYENKLFINDIPLTACVLAPPFTVPRITPATIAAYMTFCQASSLGENPPLPNIVTPLDARIRGGADVRWKCQSGNAAPVLFGGIAPLATASGTGIVNPITTRNNILANGTFGYVLSGHPNPIVEPRFQVHRFRANPDIWDKVTGTITCGTDKNNLPTSRVNTRYTTTLFPSHKLWFRTPAGAAATSILFNRPQGNFSHLWFLPIIPVP